MILLPGPPHELKALFDEQCMERLRAKLPPQFIVTRELKITGMGESQCDARVAPIYKHDRCADHDSGGGGRDPTAFEDARCIA